MIVLRIIAFTVGLWIVIATFMSAVRTFVLPRGDNVPLTRFIFRNLMHVYRLRLRKARTYDARHRLMAYYAPLGLLTLPIIWLTLVLLGYTAMFWGISNSLNWREAFVMSGSSLLTLGFKFVDEMPAIILAFSEATLGLILVALLIAYLPTMYSAFARREAAVNLLEVRAGSPPSAAEMIGRLHRNGMLDSLDDIKVMWGEWEMWFTELEESHTNLSALIFFRSPKTGTSWVVASGVVMDTAALMASTVDIPFVIQLGLAIRAGSVMLHSVAEFLQMPHNTAPQPTDPISIARHEFDEVYDRLGAEGVPLKSDRDQCWRDFAGWRVNYDGVLLRLADLTMAPYAPWISDRGILP